MKGEGVGGGGLFLYVCWERGGYLEWGGVECANSSQLPLEYYINGIVGGVGNRGCVEGGIIVISLH